MQYIRFPSTAIAIDPADIAQGILDAAYNNLETRYHDAAAVNINDNTGAFVAVGSGAAISNTIYEININCTLGEPLDFRLGADATAAAANPSKWIMNRGAAVTLKIKLVAGDKLWVRSLTTSGVTGGEITLNLMGI